MVWALYPKRKGSNSRADALKAYAARIADGVDPDLLARGTHAYAAHCRLNGVEHTPYVMQASRFFGPGKHYETEYGGTGPAIVDADGQLTDYGRTVTGG